MRLKITLLYKGSLREISRNTKLTDEKKGELYDEIYKTYLRFAKIVGT